MPRDKIGSIQVRRTKDGADMYYAGIQRNGILKRLTFETLEKARNWLTEQHVKAAEERARKRAVSLYNLSKEESCLAINPPVQEKSNELINKISSIEQQILNIGSKLDNDRKVISEILDFCKKFLL